MHHNAPPNICFDEICDLWGGLGPVTTRGVPLAVAVAAECRCRICQPCICTLFRSASPGGENQMLLEVTAVSRNVRR